MSVLATFTLVRTGATDAALTVVVLVSETGSVLDGTMPTTGTFAAGSAGAVLSIATEDDGTVEDQSTVTVTLSPGDEYKVDEASGSAHTVVQDNDGAPGLPTVSIATVATPVTDGANPVDAALVVRLADVDDAAPALLGGSVDGSVLTLTFDEALDEGSAPATSAFAVTVTEATRTVSSVGVSGNTVTLTLAPAVTSGETVTVSYTVVTGDTATPVQDAAGNAASAFANTQVTNETAAVLPKVGIAAVSTPVTEGASAAFTLSRTGATDTALTVTVSVSEAGSVLADARPSSATFASGVSEARLSIATANDAVDEADARVRVSIVAGDGYEVDAENASAAVDVFDDDAPAPVAAADELWSATLTWTDIGNNWFGGFADRFSNPGWSEDGQGFQIWYIAYNAGSRTLFMAQDGSGGTGRVRTRATTRGLSRAR